VLALLLLSYYFTITLPRERKRKRESKGERESERDAASSFFTVQSNCMMLKIDKKSSMKNGNWQQLTILLLVSGRLPS
jgi:hypothetical protein